MRSHIAVTLGRKARFATGGALVALGVGLVAFAALVATDRGEAAPIRWSANPAAVALELPPIEPPAEALQVAESPPAPASVAQLVIPKIGVAAPISTRSVETDGTMQNPVGAGDVAWYDFSALPYQGTNIVLSGHLDHEDTGPAVFWNLRQLAAGDSVQLVLEDGRTATYRVTESTTYNVPEAPIADIVGPTRAEQVTLITCNGSFDGRTRSYDERLVVRAVPV